MADDLLNTVNEALDALQASQQEVADLKQQLAKQASMALDSKLVEQTVAALRKVGALADEETAQATQLLAADPNAALRCINGLVTAQLITKTASCDTQDVSGAGKLVKTANTVVKLPTEDSRSKVLRILKTGKL